MKIFCLAGCAALFCLHALAQDPDPLAVVLANGKTVHFDSLEQKAKFEAARARQAASNAAASAPATVVPASTPRPRVASALDAPTNTGKSIVNTSAPPFTADYYMIAPAGWAGKKITLAVAYVTNTDNSARKDGLVQMTASTWNTAPTGGGDQNGGGRIKILASPNAASLLIQQCGTTLQFFPYSTRVKVTMIHGQLDMLDKSGDGNAGVKEYAFYLAN